MKLKNSRSRIERAQRFHMVSPWRPKCVFVLYGFGKRGRGTWRKELKPIARMVSPLQMLLSLACKPRTPWLSRGSWRAPLDDFRWVPLSFWFLWTFWILWISLDQIKVSRSAVGKCSLLTDELWSQIFEYVRQPPAEQLMPQREQSHLQRWNWSQLFKNLSERVTLLGSATALLVLDIVGLSTAGFMQLS